MTKLDIRCALVDYTQSEFGLFQVKMVYFYFITKILDLLDTVISCWYNSANVITFLIAGVFRFAEKIQSSHFSTSVPSHGHDVFVMDRHEIRSRWSQLLLRHTQYCSARCDVCVLPVSSTGARIQKVPLVEEIHNANSDCR